MYPRPYCLKYELRQVKRRANSAPSTTTCRNMPFILPLVLGPYYRNRATSVFHDSILKHTVALKYSVPLITPDERLYLERSQGDMFNFSRAVAIDGHGNTFACSKKHFLYLQRTTWVRQRRSVSRPPNDPNMGKLVVRELGRTARGGLTLDVRATAQVNESG